MLCGYVQRATEEADGFGDVSKVSVGVHGLGGNPKDPCSASKLAKGIITCCGYEGMRGFKGAFLLLWPRGI